MNLATQIVLGSREIDRMKEEIAIVINTITGLLRDSGIHTTEPRIEFSIGSCRWDYMLGKQESGHHMTVRCFRPDATDRINNGMSCCLVFDGAYQGMRLQYADVGYVYTQMDAFAQEMIVQFPVLEKRLKPLIEAAERKHRFD